MVPILAAATHLGFYAMLFFGGGFVLGLVTALIIYFIIRGKHLRRRGFEVQMAVVKVKPKVEVE